MSRTYILTINSNLVQLRLKILAFNVLRLRLKTLKEFPGMRIALEA